MNWGKVTNISYNKFELPFDWLKLEYFEALNILFRIENSLRVFVYIILKNEFREKWKDLSITSDDEEASTINAIAKKRIAQDRNYAYLGYSLNSPLLHLTSGELIRIITSDKYWRLFKPYFLGTKEIIKNKLDEIGNVRNSVAHFRPIKEGDVDLIKQNSIHALSRIEETLNDFINCPDVVPTNLDESWFKELTSLRTEECNFGFKQSKNEQWVKLILTFNSPILRYHDYKHAIGITLLNLKTNSLLNTYTELTKHTIAISEKITSFYDKSSISVNTKIKKSLQFTFSQSSISQNYKIIKEQFEMILLHISNESALIKDDNLARGKLIEMVESRLDKSPDTTYYTLLANPLITELGENTPVEFWGALNHSSSNFITDTESYPWMPVTISDGLPF